MKLLCAINGFIETWLDPAMWRFHLAGISIRVDGHLYDQRRWQIANGREYEYSRCQRCGSEIEQGWRPIG